MVIDVISGGYSAGGASNRAKKAYAREVCRVDSKRPRKNPSLVISFSDEDYGGKIIEEHQDASVITTKIGTNTVKKYWWTVEAQSTHFTIVRFQE